MPQQAEFHVRCKLKPHISYGSVYNDLVLCLGVQRSLSSSSIHPHAVAPCCCCCNSPDDAKLLCSPLHTALDAILLQACPFLQGLVIKVATTLTASQQWHNYGFVIVLQIHWFSIINSCVTVLLLTGFLATILMRVLKKDFVKYTRDDEAGELQTCRSFYYLQAARPLHALYRTPSMGLVLGQCSHILSNKALERGFILLTKLSHKSYAPQQLVVIHMASLTTFTCRLAKILSIYYTVAIDARTLAASTLPARMGHEQHSSHPVACLIMTSKYQVSACLLHYMSTLSFTIRKIRNCISSSMYSYSAVQAAFTITCRGTHR